jgi:hypothetical protein
VPREGRQRVAEEQHHLHLAFGIAQAGVEFEGHQLLSGQHQSKTNFYRLQPRLLSRRYLLSSPMTPR